MVLRKLLLFKEKKPKTFGGLWRAYRLARRLVDKSVLALF
jgi:hypothetical protein